LLPVIPSAPFVPAPATNVHRRNVTVDPFTRTAMLDRPFPASSWPTASGDTTRKSSTAIDASTPSTVNAIVFAAPVTCAAPPSP
jgi:hypothetical protein